MPRNPAETQDRQGERRSSVSLTNHQALITCQSTASGDALALGVNENHEYKLFQKRDFEIFHIRKRFSLSTRWLVNKPDDRRKT
jgi:hypothetical protein